MGRRIETVPSLHGAGIASLVLAMLTCISITTGCQQDDSSLPVAHAAAISARVQKPVPAPAKAVPLAIDVPPEPLSSIKSCYTFIQKRPAAQRAKAVQARLREADRMWATFNAQPLAVDLLGDHVNVLALTFPVVWPTEAPYAEKVSSIVEKYFSASEIEDDLCESGFAEIRLLARGVNDGRTHSLWTARVSSEGLVKIGANGSMQLLAGDFADLPPE